MALTIGQIAATSYEAVLNDKRKPENQWADATLLHVFEKVGILVRKNFGKIIELSLDYRRNPGAKFLATDTDPLSKAKTEVLTAAQYTIAELGVPVSWTMLDEVQTPSENAKFDFVDSMLDNAFESHDDLMEQGLFEAVTERFTGLPTIIPTTGLGQVGGVDATTEAFWRNPAAPYAADGSDIEAVLTLLWNDSMKGSGSPQRPTVLFGGSEPVQLYESGLLAQRMYTSQDLAGGSKSLAFKTANMHFSQYGDDKIYGASAKTLKLFVAKNYFRAKGETQRRQDGVQGSTFDIYTALQLATPAKSRLFVAYEG